VHFLNAGDRALVVEFGDTIDQHLLASVSALNHSLLALHATGQLPGLIETVPTFRSLAIVFDPLQTSHSELQTKIAQIPPRTAKQSGPENQRHWRLPVHYGGAYGPDLDDVAARLGSSVADVIELHSSAHYSVYMLGFLPGFAFMGDTPEALRLPRRTEPRTTVPRGSVAIALQLTAVYPWQSPGGWHLLGHCPIPLFDGNAEQPVLLTANDKVDFEPISLTVLKALQKDIDQGLDVTGSWSNGTAPPGYPLGRYANTRLDAVSKRISE